ncbi:MULTISPECIES: hypothetical protein [Geobacillus]|uniref:Uncharacterized protein n=1 Tax=Geobacillus thermocatenulatus TaxID=33938 RepID=A0A226Q9G8_9BACL|nr:MULTISPECIES: hypothetical protein [Geobacillus]KPC98036.1 hypothetical protein LR69_03723 [Geobacillus sp. BCO2]RAN22414.1 hypothetical protein VC88_11520 [Geobacillus sp. A8]ASS98362.1 hypothetical protein GT3921_04430 [Geobacillus thermocatenulatus]KLR74212.1 hypothetical protein ABH20_06790 [Geobacillus sp. T6]OXB89123.1 hypothetical protein B9L19_03295 [Geobacillus thermocatenulatus]
MWPSVLNLFLYFPEDKREYIPAAISFAVFFLMAVFTMRLIIVISRRQEREAKRLEEQLLGKQAERKEPPEV